jgi:hypothetical protein
VNRTVHSRLHLILLETAQFLAFTGDSQLASGRS